MTTDRRALNILLAALELEQCQLATMMGYEAAYVANVFNGFTPPSDIFKLAFGEVLSDLLLGKSRCEGTRLAARPLAEYLARVAAEAPSKEQFYADLGLTSRGWGNRHFVTEQLVDRVCCQLGVHPSAIYGRDYEVDEAS